MQTLEILYYLASILMTLSLALAALTFWWNRNKKREDIERLKALESLKILEVFQSEVIPKIEKFRDNMNRTLPNNIDKKDFLSEEEKMEIIESNYEIEDRQLAVRAFEEALARSESGGGDILNQLEHICTFVENKICNEEILKEPIAKILVDFKEDNETIIIYTRMANSGGDFKSLNNTYDRWKEYIEDKEQQIQLNRSIEKLLRAENEKV